MRSRLPALALTVTLTIAGAGALAQAEAERRLDAAIERLRTALGPDARVQIGTRRVDPVTGQATLTNVVLSEGANRLTIPELHLADLTDTRIGRAEAHRATWQGRDGLAGELSRALVTALVLPPPGQPFTPDLINLGGLELEAFQMADSEKSMTLDRITLRDASRAGIAAALVQGFAFRDVSGSQQQMRIGRLELAAVTLPLKGDDFDPEAFRAGRIEIERAEVREGGQNVQLALGRLALTDWLPGRTMTLRLTGLDIATPAGAGQLALRLAELESSGIDAPGSLSAVLGNRQTPDPQPGRPQRVLLAGLDASLDGTPVLSLGRFSTEAGLEGGIMSAAMLIEALRVTPPRGQADWLDMLGYREIVGGSELRASQPRAGGRLEVEPWRIGFDQAGTLSLSLRAEQMPAPPAAGAEVDPFDMLSGLMEAQLGAVTLTYRDQGLFGRVLAMQARQQRIPEARLREQWAQMALAMPIPGAGPERPPQRTQPATRPAPRPAPQAAAPRADTGGKAKIGMPGAPAIAAAPAQPAQPEAGGDPFLPMRQALAAFIRQPGTLEVALRPATPVPFAEISGMAGEPPAATVRRLGLSVTHR